ncbi:hypothetical protein BPA30113_07098 [Burkholderia paludis]|uniref:Uncharacterized protein n=1 Tax=Burkholderia paludis TaxID=1506587 RepID=A0A6P2S1B2_9BURK|nr:hypothetical protein BPA30113_07098 [Burkholderia paludis]
MFVAAPVTVACATADTPLGCDASPEYTTLMSFTPTGSALVVKLAVPFVITALPRTVLPLKNVTSPPSPPLTFACSVTGSPSADEPLVVTVSHGAVCDAKDTSAASASCETSMGLANCVTDSTCDSPS